MCPLKRIKTLRVAHPNATSYAGQAAGSARKSPCARRRWHAEGLAVDEGERGDDEDDAGRCRSGARGPRPVPLL